MFNGKQYPSDQYHFDFSTYTASTVIDDGVNDIYRAYQDYTNAINETDRCGKLLTFDEWCVSPIFVFNVDDVTANISDNTCYVNIWYRNSTVSGVYLFAAAYFKDRINLKFDHNGFFEGLQEIM